MDQPICKLQVYKSILIEFPQYNLQKQINIKCQMSKKFTFHIVEETPFSEAKTSETIYSSRRIGNNTKNS